MGLGIVWLVQQVFQVAPLSRIPELSRLTPFSRRLQPVGYGHFAHAVEHSTLSTMRGTRNTYFMLGFRSRVGVENDSCSVPKVRVNTVHVGCVIIRRKVILVPSNLPLSFCELALAALAIAYTAPAAAQQSAQSRCADCHYANAHLEPDPSHIADWEHSAHGRNDVGCESCHGGNAGSFESFVAHREILDSTDPASSTNRRNLPRTCSKCHVGQFVEFQKSKHYELLLQGDENGPSCSTCHGSVAAHLLSPRGLERTCESCHGPDGVKPNSDFPPQGRILLTRTRNLRELFRTAENMIERIRDADERTYFDDALEQAGVPLTEAVHTAHSFSFDRVEERLDRAGERIESLLDLLVNEAPQR